MGKKAKKPKAKAAAGSARTGKAGTKSTLPVTPRVTPKHASAEAGKRGGVKTGTAGKVTPKQKAEAKPRIGVFVCNCGTNIAGFLDTKAVAEYSKNLPNVVFVRENLYSCSEAGVNDIRQAIVDNKLDRVVVAACTPRTHEPTFRAVCEEAGLNSYHFEFVNIREHVSWVHKEERDIGTQKAKDLIRMGVARSAFLEPMEPIEGDVVRRALIIGGGVAGMTSALELAGRGFEVVLVEKTKDLGGLLRGLDEIYPWGEKAEKYLKGMVSRVKNERLIKVLTSSEVTDVKGYIGKYEIYLTSQDDPVVAGVIVLATGARPLDPEDLYGHDGKKVITLLEAEGLLKQPKYKRKHIVILGCAGARIPERFYCSRICCLVGIKDAVLMRKRWKADVTFLYRDLMCYGVRNETLLADAKKAGVRFVNYGLDSPPEIKDGKVRVTSDILGRDLEVPCDLLVLATPLVPQETNEALCRILKVPVDEYGFFLEAHVKLRPLDFATDGIFVCGTARWPATVTECIEQAVGAASRASTYLATGKVKVEPIVSVVDEEECRGCGLCVALCPYGAIEIVETDAGKKARTIEVACKGCGTCGATCYRGAITMRHYSNDQLVAQIRAAFVKE
jgi:heterodisulfide reductase subunit A